MQVALEQFVKMKAKDFDDPDLSFLKPIHKRELIAMIRGAGVHELGIIPQTQVAPRRHRIIKRSLICSAFEAQTTARPRVETDAQRGRACSRVIHLPTALLLNPVQ